MPIFLTQEQIFRLLQRESPLNVYPDGDPSKFYSTAEMDSVARTLSTVYARMERTWNNLFPQLADESINEWEMTVFGTSVSGSLTLQQRRDRLLGKLRALPTISLWDILVLANSYVPDGVYVGLFEFGTVSNENLSFVYWSIGESTLGVETALGGLNVGLLTGPSAGLVFGPGYDPLNPPNDGTYIDPSLTPEIVNEIRNQQYGYQVRIYGFTLTAEMLADLDSVLTAAEPARSRHSIVDGASLNADGLIFDVPAVDRFSGVTVIARDQSSPTGFTGKAITQ